MNPPARSPLAERLRALAAFLPVFERPGFEFGHWVEPVPRPDGTLDFPYCELTPEAKAFVQAAEDFGFVMRSFDWGEWWPTAEAQRLLRDPEAVAAATPRQLGRLLTLAIREDRFGEGVLLGHYRSGLLTGIIRRASALAKEMNMPPHVSPEKAALDRILAEVGPLPGGVVIFRGQGKANRIDVPGWGLSVLQQFQFGDLRLESDRCRVVVEFESAGGVTNLAKYWPLLRDGLDDKRFLLIHLYFVGSEGDYIAHRRLWNFLIDLMRADDLIAVDWDADLSLYGPGAKSDPFPQLAARVRSALLADVV